MNNVSLGNVTHVQAVQALKDAGQHVTLVCVGFVCDPVEGENCGDRLSIRQIHRCFLPPMFSAIRYT